MQIEKTQYGYRITNTPARSVCSMDAETAPGPAPCDDGVALVLFVFITLLAILGWLKVLSWIIAAL